MTHRSSGPNRQADDQGDTMKTGTVGRKRMKATSTDSSGRIEPGEGCVE